MLLCTIVLALAGSALVGLADTLAPVPALAPEGERESTLARLGVDCWHQAGIRGRGVKIAVLDSGFHDYRSFLGKALPAAVTVQSFRGDGNLEARDSQHGILCGEVVHALAPEADLLFVNWEPERPETLLQAVLWAREHGAKVLSCSLIMPSWSDGEGGGTLHAGLSQIVGDGGAAGDMLFFACAGNLAQRHWCGPVQPDAAGYHLWTAGQRDNALAPWGNERVSVELYGRACQDLQLQVHDTASGKEVGHCLAGCEGSPCGCPFAVVRFQPHAGHQYVVRILCQKPAQTPTRSASEDSRDKINAFHLAVLGGTLHHTTACGSIPFPADGPAVHAVGAVASDGQRLSYSSCGPNSPLPKPDFVAEVPFQSTWRDRPFAGTSAAAPQAAALAALVWARHPGWTAKQVSQELRRASLDLGPMGHDWQTGHGLLRLPAMR